MSAPFSPDVLRQLLDFDPETGNLFWKMRGPEWFSDPEGRTAEHVFRRWNSRFAGKEAFTARGGGGYRMGSIFGRMYYAHRVAWGIVHGEWPQEVDHINGDRTDNRLCNLRAATSLENKYNTGAQSNNTSGYKGVWLRRDTGRWTAEIRANGEKRRLGCFDSPEEANAAYCKAAERLHGEFARTQ